MGYSLGSGTHKAYVEITTKHFLLICKTTSYGRGFFTPVPMLCVGTRQTSGGEYQEMTICTICSASLSKLDTWIYFIIHQSSIVNRQSSIWVTFTPAAFNISSAMGSA